jgi:hypothetical protein
MLFDTFWRLTLLFPRFNASQGMAQPFLCLASLFQCLLESFSQLVVFWPKALDFFLLLPRFPSPREV